MADRGGHGAAAPCRPDPRAGGDGGRERERRGMGGREGENGLRNAAGMGWGGEWVGVWLGYIFFSATVLIWIFIGLGLLTDVGFYKLTASENRRFNRDGHFNGGHLD